MDKKKKTIIIGGIVVFIIIILLIILLKDNNTGNILGGNIDNIVKKDIKNDNEKGIILTNLNKQFITEDKKKTEPFTYKLTLNGKEETLKFEKMILHNGESEAKIKMYFNDVDINIMGIINQAIVRKPTKITPTFYLLGNKDDEVLVLEILTNDQELNSKIYLAINNDGEVRNYFGGLANDDISDDEFLKAIKDGKLIYDHRIDKKEKDTWCDCKNKKNDTWLNKVISEKRIFTVLNSSLKLESSSKYTCSSYCK